MEGSIRKRIRSVLSESVGVSEIFGLFGGKKKERPVFMAIYDRLGEKYSMEEFYRPQGADYQQLWVGHRRGISGVAPMPSITKYLVRVFDDGRIIVEDKDKGKNLEASNHDKAVAYMLSEYDRKKAEAVAQKEKKKAERETAIRTAQEDIPQ